jgi:hypothetical protein
MIHRGRGRPKLDRPDKDSGTPELQRKRQIYSTEEVLDAYLRRRIISQNQHWCGIHFRWLYTLRYGIPSVKSTDPTHFGGRECKLENAEWRAERELEFAEAVFHLRKHRCFESVLNVCVYNREFITISLITGMDILEKLWCSPTVKEPKLSLP